MLDFLFHSDAYVACHGDLCIEIIDTGCGTTAAAYGNQEARIHPMNLPTIAQITAALQNKRNATHVSRRADGTIKASGKAPARTVASVRSYNVSLRNAK